MLAPHLLFGKTTEDEALEFFLQRFPRAELLIRNFRCKTGEIDLIFEIDRASGSELVFVEVRGRKKDAWVSAGESLSQTEKPRRLKRAIEYYLCTYRGTAKTMRVDLLAKDGEAWTHFQDIRL